jgi:hypothetical protein
MKIVRTVVLVSALWVGCGDSEENPNNTATNNTTPGECEVDENAYDFQDESCASTVAYDGQIARQILIKDLSSYLLSLEGQIDSGTLFPEEGDIVGALDFYFRFDGAANGGQQLRLSTEPAATQENYGVFGAGKDLVGKLAGNDSSTDHKDWKAQFKGWSDVSLAAHGGSISSPEGVVQAIFATLEKAAIDRANGVIPQDPVTGEPLPLHVTATGLDLQQLLEKFLHTGVSFSQGADDYLDDDVEGKGLLASNEGPDGENAWTPLAHQWDEGFGYFGAARHYGQFTDEELSEKGGRADWQLYNDADGDGRIDLTREYNFGASTNAAKRDLAAAALGVEIDLTGDAWGGFYEGRKLIASINGALSPAQLAELQGHRDRAVLAWEKAYMATVLHYVNDTLKEMAKFGTESYSFVKHAKVWAEAKGFAFAPLYNRNSPLTPAQYEELHGYLGDAPVLSTAEAAEIEGYQEGLRAARTLLAEAYDFDARLIGDADGSNGW